jgi:hypothetical protein
MEAFGEPAVDRSEEVPSLVGLALRVPQSSQFYRREQFEELGLTSNCSARNMVSNVACRLRCNS